MQRSCLRSGVAVFIVRRVLAQIFYRDHVPGASGAVADIGSGKRVSSTSPDAVIRVQPHTIVHQASARPEIMTSAGHSCDELRVIVRVRVVFVSVSAPAEIKDMPQFMRERVGRGFQITNVIRDHQAVLS